MTALTFAVTGLNATDNPAPGVAVIRALRDAYPLCRIVALSYDPLDSGNHMPGVADAVYLMPFPSQGTDVLKERILAIHGEQRIDVLIPTLDAELLVFIKMETDLRAHGIRTFLPTLKGLELRSKAKFAALKDDLGISVPHSVTVTDAAVIAELHEQFTYPLVVKGQFYDAYISHTPMEAEGHFHKIRAKWGLPVVVQEFIAGEEYDVVCVGDGKGALMGSVAMRKMLLTDKGKAWAGITIRDPKLHAFVVDAMAKLRWRGPCELEVMKSHSGDFYLIEVNPRFPAWVYLSVGAGRNLPQMVAQLAMDEPVSPLPPAEAGVLFVRYSYDQICSLSDFEALSTRGALQR